MGPRVSRIDFERLRGRRAGLGERLIHGPRADGDLVDDGRRQMRPGRHVLGIDLERPAQQRLALREALGGPLPGELQGLKVERVGLGVGRTSLRSRTQDLDLQLFDDVGGDLVLTSSSLRS